MKTCKRLLASLVVLSVLMPITASAELIEVVMKDYRYIPEEVTIKVGDTVRWINKERRQYHTIWFKELGEKESPEWYPGEMFEKTFDTPGDYPYICGPHYEDRGMVGIVHVVE